MQEFFPALKWVRGEPLSPENWIELFRIVKLPPATTLEKLTFGDLLSVADEIIKNVTVLKVQTRIDLFILYLLCLGSTILFFK